MFATSASVEISPQIGADRVYGKFNPDIAGTTTELHRQAALAPIEGTLNVKFYITKEFFAAEYGSNRIHPLFDVRNVTEHPIVDNRIGRYIVGDLYLTKFEFSMKPFNVIEASASYIMTGTLYRSRIGDPSISLNTMESFDPAHALRCFAIMKSGDKNMQTIDDIYPSPPAENSYWTELGNGEGGPWSQNKTYTAGNTVTYDSKNWTAQQGSGPIDYAFEITSLDYNINVDRKKSALIRSNEHSSINTRPEGAEATRISVNNMEKTMKITSNELIDRLNPYGEYQDGTVLPENNSSIATYLYSINGTRLARFECDGKIVGQNLTVNKDGMTTADVSITQILR